MDEITPEAAAPHIQGGGSDGAPHVEPRRLLYAGKHVHFYQAANGWEYVHRPNSAQGIAIVAITAENKLVLVSQHRTPLGKRALELPAGLVDDHGAGSQVAARETVEAAARRELWEETGYTCEHMRVLCTGAGSPGLTDELVSLCLAEGLQGPDVEVEPLDWPEGATRQVKSRGLAAEGEAISVYEIPVERVREWLDRQSGEQVVDLRVYAGLYFAEHGQESRGAGQQASGTRMREVDGVREARSPRSLGT